MERRPQELQWHPMFAEELLAVGVHLGVVEHHRKKVRELSVGDRESVRPITTLEAEQRHAALPTVAEETVREVERTSTPEVERVDIARLEFVHRGVSPPRQESDQRVLVVQRCPGFAHCCHDIVASIEDLAVRILQQQREQARCVHCTSPVDA